MSRKKTINMELAFQEKLRKAEILSLDIFDTCLLRKVGYPTHVFMLMEHEMAYMPRFRRLSGGSAGFYRLRICAEQQARERLYKESNTYEATLDEIYKELQVITQISTADAEELKRMEMEAERMVIIPNPAIKELANEALREGKRVIYLSNMYLPQDFIAELLKENEYPVAEGSVFVSGHYRAGKCNGDLYDIAGKQINVPFSKWLHIGDNHHSDFKAALAKGVETFRYVRQIDIAEEMDNKGRRKIPSLPTNNKKSLALGIRNAIVMQCPPSDSDDKADFLYKLGFERAGILVLGYINWLIAQCLEDKIDLMIFMARDGHILKHCFDMVCKWRGLSINTVYMYASRKAMIIPSLVSLSENDLPVLIAEGVTDVGHCLGRIDLDPLEYQQEILECGFTGVDEALDKPESTDKLRRLFQMLYSQILNRAAEQSKLCLEYLDSINIPREGNIALIDVGWTGNTLEGFNRLMWLSDRDVQTVGYFLGTIPDIECRIEKGLIFKSYLTYQGKPKIIFDCAMESIEIIEFLHLAPHGTCIGYEKTADGVRVVLSDIGMEQENVNKAMKVQEGIIDFFKAAKPVITGFPHLDLDPMGAFYPIAQTISNPKLAEAQVLGSITHSTAFGNSVLQCITDGSLPIESVMWQKGAEVLRRYGKKKRLC